MDGVGREQRSRCHAPILRSEAVRVQGQRVFCASHSLMWYVPEPLGKMADDKHEAKQALKIGEVDVCVMSPISCPDEGVE